MNDILTLAYGFARAAWRRRWIAIATTWTIALIGWAVVMMLPDRYEASAKVFVDTSTALRPVLQGIAIEDDYEAQLALVREELLSRPQLEAVATRTNLDARATTPEAREALITALKSQISVSSISPLATPGGQARQTVYTIAYQNTDRNMSVEVVRTLLSNFEQGAQSGSRTGTAEAGEFLDQRIAEKKAQLEKIEDEVMEFKKRNIGMIEGESGDYVARHELETAGLQRAETDLAAALSRRKELEAQLVDAPKFVAGTSASGSGAGGGDVTVRRQQAERSLEDLQLKYTDAHPLVIRQREIVEDLKTIEANELAELQRGGAGTGAINSLAANPVRQGIESKLNAVREEIAAHEGAASRHRRELAKLGRFVALTPEINQEFIKLTRDHATIKIAYEEMLKRSGEAGVADDAARAGGVDFEIFEPPSASLNPVSPKRQLLVIMVLFLASAAGVGMALLPHLLSPTFSDTTSLERQFGLPVLGAVSAVRTTAQRDSQLRDVRRVVYAALALVALTGVLAVLAPTGARMLHRLIA